MDEKAMVVMIDDGRAMFCRECWGKSDDELFQQTGDALNIGSIEEFVFSIREQPLIWSVANDVSDADLFRCDVPGCVYADGFDLISVVSKKNETIASLEERIEIEQERNQVLNNLLMRIGKTLSPINDGHVHSCGNCGCSVSNQ